MPRLTPDDLLAAARDAFRGNPSQDGPAAVRKPATPKPVPPIRPHWPLEIRLHKGRRVRATLVPGAARREDLAAFGDVSAANDRQAFDAIQQQSEALESLRRSHAELANKVATLQAQADRSVVGLLQGIAGLEQKLQAAKVQERVLKTQSRSARTLATHQQRALSSMATTAQIQQVTGVVNSLQSAAFGDKGSLLATNNLLLAANQLLWAFVDPILRGMGFSLGPSPSLLTWLSPVGSLLTGQLVVGNRQHVRFISGVVTFDGTTPEVSESLRTRVAVSFRREFQRRTDISATAVPLDDTIPPGSVAAFVRGGTLFVQVGRFGSLSSSGFPSGRVAWMVDTGVDGG